MESKKIKKTNTACCALCQLSNLSNSTSDSELKQKLQELSKQTVYNYEVGDISGEGQTSVFVITTPVEKNLRGLLKYNGFKKIHSFDRRTGYPEGLLKMFIKNL